MFRNTQICLFCLRSAQCTCQNVFLWGVAAQQPAGKTNPVFQALALLDLVTHLLFDDKHLMKLCLFLATSEWLCFLLLPELIQFPAQVELSALLPPLSAWTFCTECAFNNCYMNLHHLCFQSVCILGIGELVFSVSAVHRCACNC